MSVLGRDTVSGEWTDTAVGLDGDHANIAMLRTPDGNCRLELSIPLDEADARFGTRVKAELNEEVRAVVPASNPAPGTRRTVDAVS